MLAATKLSSRFPQRSAVTTSSSWTRSHLSPNGLQTWSQGQVRNMTRGKYYERKRDYGEPQTWPVEFSRNRITYAQLWNYENKNPYEWLSPKIPDPPVVGEQTSKDEFLTERQKGATRTIRMHLPKRYNALTPSAIKRLSEYIIKYQTKPTSDLVTNWTLQGSDQAWCTGYDLKYLYDKRDSPEALTMIQNMHQLVYDAHHSKAGMIVVLDGIVSGAGVGIALNAPYRVATERSVFAVQEPEYGLIPNPGVCHALAKHGPLGMYLALSGHKLVGHDLVHAGLCSYYIPMGSLPALKHALGECFTGQVQELTINLTDASEPVDDQRYSLLEHVAQINYCFSRPTLGGIINALKEEGSLWATETLQKIRTSSPISIAMTFEMIQHSKNLTLEESLRQDYLLIQSFLKGKDFFQGIEKLVLNRDAKETPKWSNKTIEEVIDSMASLGPEYFDVGSKHQLKLRRAKNLPELYHGALKFDAWRKYDSTPDVFELAEQEASRKQYYFDIDRAVNEAEEEIFAAERGEAENAEHDFVARGNAVAKEVEEMLKDSSLSPEKRKQLEGHLSQWRNHAKKARLWTSEERQRIIYNGYNNEEMQGRIRAFRRGDDQALNDLDQNEQVEAEAEVEEPAPKSIFKNFGDDKDFDYRRETPAKKEPKLNEHGFDLKYLRRGFDPLKKIRAIDDNLSPEERKTKFLDEFGEPIEENPPPLTLVKDYTEKAKLRNAFDWQVDKQQHRAEVLADQIFDQFAFIVDRYPKVNIFDIAEKTPARFITDLDDVPFAQSAINNSQVTKQIYEPAIRKLKSVLETYQEEALQAEWERANVDIYTGELRYKPQISWLEESMANSDLELADMYTGGEVQLKKRWDRNEGQGEGKTQLNEAKLKEQEDARRAKVYFSRRAKEAATKKEKKGEESVPEPLPDVEIGRFIDNPLEHNLRRSLRQAFEHANRSFHFLEKDLVELGGRKTPSVFSILHTQNDLEEGEQPFLPEDRTMSVAEAYAGANDHLYYLDASGKLREHNAGNIERLRALEIQKDWKDTDSLHVLNRDDILLGDRPRYFEQLDWADDEVRADLFKEQRGFYEWNGRADDPVNKL
eukprot:TRINITY_DN2010_c0_g1_i1.p1 TRINITY_DN2010_c0_g1~~TRINITY_DN2010_c0_g1_i1.p1  ORF type:complete len:1088 (-),score=336.64 TRINITY_DN2010_c0_g1_i1:65-3328(-)